MHRSVNRQLAASAVPLARAAHRSAGALFAAIALIALGMPQPAAAQYRDHGWRQGDIHQFHDRDYSRWRGGRWYNGYYGGRHGWWWVVPGAGYYYYRAPIYPYPDPYVPPVVSAAPSSGFWYYCASPPGYYPYVPRCAGPWQPVPAR